LLGFNSALLAQTNDLKINEVRYYSQYGPTGEFLHAFVELYNRGNVPINVNNYHLVNNQDAVIATLPNWTIPAESFLTVFFGEGVDDSDFTDNEGVFYTQGDSPPIWTTDQFVDIAAYSTRPTMGLMIDGYDTNQSSDWVEFDWTSQLNNIGATNPVLTSPVNGSTIDSDSLFVKWRAIPYTYYYQRAYCH